MNMSTCWYRSNIICYTMAGPLTCYSMKCWCVMEHLLPGSRWTFQRYPFNLLTIHTGTGSGCREELRRYNWLIGNKSLLIVLLFLIYFPIVLVRRYKVFMGKHIELRFLLHYAKRYAH